MSDLSRGQAQVLLAEDDFELRRMLVRALENIGYVVYAADTGRALLERLWERARAGEQFDLIVSDICMPGANGVEVLEGLRDQCEPCIGETPLILITAFGDQRAHAAAKRLRADLFDKPFDIDALCAWAVSRVPPRPQSLGRSDLFRRKL